MTAPYDYRYTDQDVRENGQLRDMALQYLRAYGGEFDPLVEARHALDDGLVLTTPMIRRVLNCMRHDFKVAPKMPPPIRLAGEVVSTDGDGHVVAAHKIPRQRESEENLERHPQYGYPIQDCGEEDPHYEHSWEYGSGRRKRRVWCNGVPWAINREPTYTRPAKVHYEFATSQSGKLVHRLTGVGWVRWWTNDHEYGWHPRLKPELSVDLVCIYPSIIKNPILFKEEPVHLYDVSLGRERCKHCFKED